MNSDEILELDAQLEVADTLIEKRVREPKSLQRALKILIPLEVALRKRAKGRREDAITERLIRCLGMICAAYNHRGAIKEQANRFNGLRSLLSKSKGLGWLEDITAHYVCAAMNGQFNAYNFQGALKEADSLYRSWVKKHNPTPGTLGQIIGSLGQANAFLARSDDSGTYARRARDLFRESRACYTNPNDVYHAMAVNYLATLEWQERDAKAALAAMRQHPGLPRFDSAEELSERIGELASLAANRPYDVLNLLRIIELSSNPPAPVGTAALGEAVLNRKSKEHPHAQIAYWAASAAMKTDNLALGERLLEESISATEGEFFTIRTLSLPSLALKAQCARRQNKETEFETCLMKIINLTSKLNKESVYFGEYLAGVEGRKELETVANGGLLDIGRALRLLPFAYS